MEHDKEESAAPKVNIFVKKKKVLKETTVSKNFRVLCEVEKMLIMLDEDGIGALKLDDVQEYLVIMATTTLLLSINEIREIFESFDTNKVGILDKK